MRVLPDSGTLLGALQARFSDPTKRSEALLSAAEELGLDATASLSPPSVAFALLKSGLSAEAVSRLLSWKEFEGMSAALLRAAGWEVRENVYLTKPRAQIDVVAKGDSMVLSVDCKHYRRGLGPAGLARVALAQLQRSSALRRRTEDPRPIASVILTMSEPEGAFVKGVAIVPVRTLNSFVTSFEAYQGYLDLR